MMVLCFVLFFLFFCGFFFFLSFSSSFSFSISPSKKSLQNWNILKERKGKNLNSHYYICITSAALLLQDVSLSFICFEFFHFNLKAEAYVSKNCTKIRRRSFFFMLMCTWNLTVLTHIEIELYIQVRQVVYGCLSNH